MGLSRAGLLPQRRRLRRHDDVGRLRKSLRPAPQEWLRRPRDHRDARDLQQVQGRVRFAALAQECRVAVAQRLPAAPTNFWLKLLTDWLTSLSVLRVSAIKAPDFLSKLSISSRSEITVGSNSPPYLSLPRLFRNFSVAVILSSTALTPDSAASTKPAISSPFPDSELVKVSKLRSVSFTAASFSIIARSTLRSATRSFCWMLIMPSGSAVNSGMPSAPSGAGGAPSDPPVNEIAAMPVRPWNSRPTSVSFR